MRAPCADVQAHYAHAQCKRIVNLVLYVFNNLGFDCVIVMNDQYNGIDYFYYFLCCWVKYYLDFNVFFQ